MAARKPKTARKVKAAAPKLDKFTRSYMETALWSTTDNADDSGGEPLDKNYGIGDISDETTALMIGDCALFQERYADMLSESGFDNEKAGYYFWLARNEHGAGFTDDDYKVAPEVSAAMKGLQKAAQSFGEFDLQVDDGVISGPQGGHTVAETRVVNDSKALLDARAKLAAVGMAIKKTDGEYRVYPKGNRDPDIGYFTDDLDDAVATGIKQAATMASDWATRPIQESHRVADFPSVIDALEGAQRDGATQVLLPSPENADTYVFFPEGHSFLKVKVFEKHGKWHVGARDTGKESMFPRYSRPIGDAIFELRGTGGVRETNMVRDYIAVDPGGRVVGGPFKDYSEAKARASKAGGYVQFAMGEMNEASSRRPKRETPRTRGRTARPAKFLPMTADAVMKLAGELAHAVGVGGTAVHIQGGFRYSDKNESARFTIHSPEYAQKVVVVVSIFKDGSTALNFFSNEDLSGTSTYESISSFNYYGDDTHGMVNDIKWVLKTVDSYAESHHAGQEEMDEGSRSSKLAASRRKRTPTAEQAGAQYAQDQIEGDYFKQWIFDQMIEAKRMGQDDPTSVYPLETKKDYRKLAKNMLQQLTWDTKRDLNESKEFFEGFTEELERDTTIDWLADELKSIHNHLHGKLDESRVQARPSKRSTDDRKTAWMRAFQDACVDLGAHPGKLDWQTAEYLFRQGVDAKEAATRVCSKRTEEAPVRHRSRTPLRAASVRRRGR